jgi:hypothetical protein
VYPELFRIQSEIIQNLDPDPASLKISDSTGSGPTTLKSKMSKIFIFMITFAAEIDFPNAAQLSKVILRKFSTYPKRSTVMGGEEGGVCIGPAMLLMPRVEGPQWEPGGARGVQWSPFSLSGGVSEPGSCMPGP